jgi:inosose dehydratase
MPRTDIRWSTNLISFFNSAYWGLAPNLAHPGWVIEFDKSPRFYFDAMLDVAAALGLDAVELAPDPGGFGRALIAYGDSAGFKKALDVRGLVLSSSYAPGRQLIGNALADSAQEAVADEYIENHARFLSELGAKIIVVGNVPRSRFGNDSPDDTASAADFDAPVTPEVHERFAEQLNRLAAITARYDVKIAIHTDAYSVCVREQDIATVLELTDPTYVMVCPDAGHITIDGGDAVEVLRKHLPRIPTMHWKDCAGPLSGHLLRGSPMERHAVMLQRFRVMGSGVVDWNAWMSVLDDNEWSGWATEEIDHSPAPVDELRQGLDYYRELLARRAD